ncbi:MAG: hypothetical protein RR702_04400, partial [Clostridia bacterium]
LAVTSLTSSIFAADITTETTGTTPITYTVGPTFVVTIPETIAASTTTNVEVPVTGNANMEPNKKLSVTIQLAESKVVLTRAGGADTIDVSLKQAATESEAGTPVAAAKTEVASFTNGTTNGVATKLFVNKLDAGTISAKKAGAYTGNLTFTIAIVQ